jgi:hypothetical protein
MFSYSRNYVSGKLRAPAALLAGERAPSTRCRGGWAGLRAGVDDMEKRKFLTYRDSNFDPWVIQPVASHYTDYVSAALRSTSSSPN